MIVNIDDRSLVINTDSLNSCLIQLLNSYFKPSQSFVFDVNNNNLQMLGLRLEMQIHE